MPSAESPGKGSGRRPPAISQQEMERRWRRVFGGTTDALEILRREHGAEMQRFVEEELKKLKEKEKE